MTKSIIQALFDAADNHGEDTGEYDHAVGDLHDLLRAAWAAMPPSARAEFLRDDAVQEVLDAGGRGEVDVEDLQVQLDSEQVALEQRMVAAGYQITQTRDGIYIWETATEKSIEFVGSADAVHAAEQDFAGDEPDDEVGAED